MVDIHCHILPALDDGARGEEVSAAMAAMAIEDGITHIVATPHANYQYRFDPEINRQKRDRLQQSVGDGLTLLLGCDFHLSYENLESLRLDPKRYTINATQYLLVEFADNSIPPGMDQIFSGLLTGEIVPIMTHPERNPLLAEDTEQLRKWIDLGCLVQVRANSVVGRFGKMALKSSQTLLRHDMVHFIASDAHNTTTRAPVLSEARRVIAAERGEEVAEALCGSNPLAVVEGRGLPWRPEPAPVAPRKWYSFLR